MSETKLTKKQTEKREQLETIVDQWIDQALEAGKALMVIKKEKLYRETHKNFEEYIHERFAKTRQWAYNFVNWYEVNYLAETLDHPLSNRAATKLSSVAKNAPDKVKQIVADAAKIALESGRSEPTENDVVAAKLKVIPVNAPPVNAPAPKKTDKVRKVFEVSIVVDEMNRMEVIGILDDLKVKYEQQGKCGLCVMMDSVSAFMLYAGQVFDKAESFEFSIQGQKVEVTKQQSA